MKVIWRFYWILKRKVYLAKINILSKHHDAGPNAATSAWGRPCQQGFSVVMNIK